MSSTAKPEIGGFAKSAPKNRSVRGPFDFSENLDIKPYVNLGAILLPPMQGLVLKLQVEEANNRVVAVDLELNGSKLQLQAFAAPRSEGLWLDILTQIEQQIVNQQGTITEKEGPLGPEAYATVPTSEGDTTAVTYIGVDGPRWFLRGVVTGRATTDSAEMEKIYALFRSVVVKRGDVPMPPRDLIPLHIPSPGPGRSNPSPYTSADPKKPTQRA